MSSVQLTATIVITSKDRCDELRTAVASAVKQTWPVEVLVIDDGSSDGTSEMLAAEFPSVRVIRHEQSTGLIYARNQGAAEAKGDIVFSIDDDAEFSTAEVVSQTMSDFCDPTIGAVAIPYMDVNKDDVLRQKSPDDAVWLTDRFIGTAHALRRELFLKLEGYRTELFHQGEERDYCIRMLDAGYHVRLGTADMIYHYESPRRSTARMDFYGRRNDILFVAFNVPLLKVPVFLAGTTWNGLRYGLRVGSFRMLTGLAAGYMHAIRYFSLRRPVRTATFNLFRTLQKEPKRVE